VHVTAIGELQIGTEGLTPASSEWSSALPTTRVVDRSRVGFANRQDTASERCAHYQRCSAFLGFRKINQRLSKLSTAILPKTPLRLRTSF